jgi:hypothetical protein
MTCNFYKFKLKKYKSVQPYRDMQFEKLLAHEILLEFLFFLYTTYSLNEKNNIQTIGIKLYSDLCRRFNPPLRDSN